jgi:hypothetical protein
MPTKVSAGEWLGVKGPPPAALSVPMNRQPQLRVSRPISGSQYQQKNDLNGQEKIDRLRWRVLLLAGEHGNVHLETDDAAAAAKLTAHGSPRVTDSSKQKEPFWTSSVRVQSAVGTQQQTLASPNSRVTTPRGATVVPFTLQKEPAAGSSSASLTASTAATGANFATSGGQPVHDVFGTLLGDAAAHSASRQQRRHRCGQVIPVTAIFTRDKGVFLHDTLPAVASTPEMDAVSNHPPRSSADSSAQTTIPTGDRKQAKVPAPPPARDMQTIKRLIRLVQVETGENHFRTPLDSKVLQSLIPTATMHRAHNGRMGSVTGASKKSDGGSAAATGSDSPKRRPHTASGRSKVPLSPQRTGIELPTSVVGTSVTGDLALHVRSGGNADESEVSKPAAINSSTTAPAAAPSQQQRNLPRPQSARVSRPSFTYQRMFDGYTTLEQRQGTQGPTFSHFSSTAIPVVGRR